MFSRTQYVFALVAAATLVTGCGGDSAPTGPSAVVTPTPAGMSSISSPLAPSSRTGNLTAATTPFTCAESTDVRVRFGEPGFSFGPVVGLFVAYDNLPPGEKTLEISWDELSAPELVERIPVGEGDPNRDGTGFNLAGLIAFYYPDLESSEQKQVRVNLRINERDGECARVRRVTVSPGASLGISPGVGGGRGETGLELEADEGDQGNVGPGGVFNISAGVHNRSDEVQDGGKLVFVTPPGATIATKLCGREAAGVVICDVGDILPGTFSGSFTVTYRAPDVENAILPGQIGLVVEGTAGQVADYFVSVSGVAVRNLREP